MAREEINLREEIKLHDNVSQLSQTAQLIGVIGGGGGLALRFINTRASECATCPFQRGQFEKLDISQREACPASAESAFSSVRSIILFPPYNCLDGKMVTWTPRLHLQPLVPEDRQASAAMVETRILPAEC